ncbi:hypothetical protein F0562_004497 [Nyssa sinensis]|uniref:Uncharacterized protein n=1 Tax=Nyssa sinensis TaxID=561372 RepID=A0A5J5C2U7_9ASTE|nr:hypothetical protein F0562_004497 [Nyssa sinensis]
MADSPTSTATAEANSQPPEPENPGPQSNQPDFSPPSSSQSPFPSILVNPNPTLPSSIISPPQPPSIQSYAPPQISTVPPTAPPSFRPVAPPVPVPTTPSTTEDPHDPQFLSPPPHRYLFDLRHRNGCDVGGCVVGHGCGCVVASVVLGGIGDGDGAGNGCDVGGCVVGHGWFALTVEIILYIDLSGIYFIYSTKTHLCSTTENTCTAVFKNLLRKVLYLFRSLCLKFFAPSLFSGCERPPEARGCAFGN